MPSPRIMRSLLALSTLLWIALILAVPRARSVPLADASGETRDGIGGMQIRELKDELIAERLSCGGGEAAGVLPLLGAVGLIAWSARRRRRDLG